MVKPYQISFHVTRSGFRQTICNLSSNSCVKCHNPILAKQWAHAWAAPYEAMIPIWAGPAVCFDFETPTVNNTNSVQHCTMSDMFLAQVCPAFARTYCISYYNDVATYLFHFTTCNALPSSSDLINWSAL